MSSIDSFNFNGKRALIRVDFNVPLNERLNVTDATRVAAASPTIKKILADGGSVVLMSHLGRPKNGPEDKLSLKHIVKTLESQINSPVQFTDDCIGESALLASPESKAKPPENPMSADRVKWEHIHRVFELCNRNVSETARRLKMHRRTLQRILSKRSPR